ncbi:hypothetical protein BCR32DRAFT_301343 [Anaeromyces robustus]|uniref:Uncharacterized protein n=1 Tax=Anaeromyces robustus TaxID=1754192 RepID=A0A1Y1WZK5_9FUNG|nr:hypothetical protein BCR32DRAFT_301343 [Anaeromyces robustus]|eukprot:ORX78825.1 hypothetical protein BCR32DRAFT_301343 [Anaeromyces robustus]
MLTIFLIGGREPGLLLQSSPGVLPPGVSPPLLILPPFSLGPLPPGTSLPGIFLLPGVLPPGVLPPGFNEITNNSPYKKEWKCLFKCQTESGTYSKSPYLLRSAALLNDIMLVFCKRQHILFNKFKTNLSSRTD